MKKIMLLSLLFLIMSCGNKEDICPCIAAGKELNSFSEKMLTVHPTKSEFKKMKQLQKVKREKCVSFQAMKGEKMLVLMNECIEN
jgi:hypothetical protein